MNAVLLLLMLGVAGEIAPCEPDGQDICGLERPEDITLVPGSDWAVVSTLSPGTPLVLLQLSTRHTIAVSAAAWQTRAEGASHAGSRQCPGPPAHFRAAGHDVRKLADDVRLAVINRGNEQAPRIELFSVAVADAGPPQLTWIGCVPVEVRHRLNDVAIGSDGTLFATHMFSPPASPAEQAALRESWQAGTQTGYALRWHGDDNWHRMADTDLSFANGIAVSADGRTLAVAGTYSRAVVMIDLDGGPAQRMDLPLQPDNLSAELDGGFLVTGHTGTPVTGIDPCRDASIVACGFPFAVARIRRDGNYRIIFEHDGRRIPGASVAVEYRGRLHLGTAFGDRISVVKPARSPGSSALDAR